MALILGSIFLTLFLTMSLHTVEGLQCYMCVGVSTEEPAGDCVSTENLQEVAQVVEVLPEDASCMTETYTTDDVTVTIRGISLSRQTTTGSTNFQQFSEEIQTPTKGQFHVETCREDRCNGNRIANATLTGARVARAVLQSSSRQSSSRKSRGSGGTGGGYGGSGTDTLRPTVLMVAPLILLVQKLRHI